MTRSRKNVLLLAGLLYLTSFLLVAAAVAAKADAMPAGTWTGEIFIMPEPDPTATQPPPPVVLDPVWTQPSPTSGDDCVAMNNGDEFYRGCYVGDPERMMPEWLAHFQDAS